MSWAAKVSGHHLWRVSVEPLRQDRYPLQLLLGMLIVVLGSACGKPNPASPQPGQTPSPDDIFQRGTKPIAPGSSEAAKVEEAMGDLAVICPEDAADIQAEIDTGGLTIAELTETEGGDVYDPATGEVTKYKVAGRHDHDTIAVNLTTISQAMVPAAILHEWRHAKSAKDAGTNTDPNIAPEMYENMESYFPTQMTEITHGCESVQKMCEQKDRAANGEDVEAPSAEDIQSAVGGLEANQQQLDANKEQGVEGGAITQDEADQMCEDAECEIPPGCGC